MPLSVVSTFARLNLDPWTEAAELARMPPARAAQRLSSLLAQASGGTSVHPDPEGLATRLVRLLPAPSHATAPSGWRGADVASPALSRSIWITGLIMLASLAAAFLIEMRTPAAGVTGPASQPAPATSSAP